MERIIVNLNEIKFWNENPREPLDPEWNDTDIISHYKKHEKLDDLINSIKNQGLIEDIIGMREGKYIKVFDGNRRVAALKSIAFNRDQQEQLKVYVKLYHDYQEVLKVIDIIHGTGSGASRKRWSAFQRDRFNDKVGFPLSSPKAFNFLKRNGIEKYTPYVRDKYIEYTTLERILNYRFLIDLFANVEENKQLDVLLKVAKYTKKKINSRNAINEQTFMENFGTNLKKVCEEHKKFQTKLWDTGFDLSADPSVNKKAISSVEIEQLGDVESNEFTNHREKEEVVQTANNNVLSGIDTMPFKRNAVSKRSYKFFNYRNMNRPVLEVGELNTCLAKVSQLTITEKTFEDGIPISIMYRPIFEAHIRLVGQELIKVEDLNKKKRINNIGLEPLLSTAEKSLCNENSIYKIYELGKEFTIIKKGEGFDKKEIKYFVGLMGDIAHGRRFYCKFEELVELDKFVKKYIEVIYALLNIMK